jgi:hypothetical protein
MFNDEAFISGLTPSFSRGALVPEMFHNATGAPSATCIAHAFRRDAEAVDHRSARIRLYD